MNFSHLPARWPEIALALALVVAASYLVADVVSRLAQGAFGRLLGPGGAPIPFVRQPVRVLRITVFLLLMAVLSLPAMKMAGLRVAVGRTPEAVVEWALESGVRIALIALVAYLVVRAGTVASRRFEQEMSQGTGIDVLERAKRAQTLGTVLQKTLSVSVTIVATLMIMRELRVDIMPVLTGAGIVGLAVGFGAQTLVRDVISGFFLILENQVRVGDVAKVNGQGGFVEAINLRTMVLRDYDGTVYVFPNGEIKTLANLTKDFAYYVLDVGIAYEQDPDGAMAVLREIGDGLRRDPQYGPLVLSDLEIAGVDAFAASQVTIKARIKTVPLRQWEVGRELRRRVQKAFTERGLTMPYPQLDIRVRSLPRDHSADDTPPARL